MNESKKPGRYFFAPRTGAEAASLLRACTERAARGSAVRVRLAENPFSTPGLVCAHGPEGTADSPGEPAPGVLATGFPPVSVAPNFQGPPGVARNFPPPPAAPLEDILTEAQGEAPMEIDLSCRAMDGITGISGPDMLAVAGGGVTLGRLRKAAAEKGLYFPFEPESLYEERTLAGLVMDGTVSAYEGRYGRLREYLLSIEGVTAAGETFHTGSRSVKDVAGYELAGFLSGIGGRFAMITSVTLRLLRRPGTVATFAVTGEYAGLRHLAREIFAALNPAGMEMSMESSSRALLLLAVHDPAAGREKGIESAIQGLIGGRALTLAAGADMERERSTFEPGFVRLAADIGTGASAAGEGEGFRESLYPHRGRWHIPRKEFEPGGLFTVAKERARFAARLAPGFRIRAEINYGTPRAPLVGRIRPSAEAGGVASFLAGLESADALDEIMERLLDVFDPERILSD